MKNYTESSGSYKFLHKDYLGSVLAITDESGNIVEQRHYDAWGQFTHLKVGNGAIITDKDAILNLSKDLIIDRGYTSHEHLYEVGLIHMNGRLYDPVLRRFLNADENIQDMFNTQNYNKYGYVLNNPLMYNDPNGEFFQFLIPVFIWLAANSAAIGTAALIGAGIGAGMYLAQGLVSGNLSWGGFIKAAFVGGLTGAVSGALGQVFSASGFWAAVGNGALAGAGSGGVTSLINGTNFLDGLLKGAVIGGAVAGISYTVNYYVKGYNKNITEDIEIPGYEQNGEYFKSERELKDYVDNNIGNSNTIEKTLKTDIQLASPTNLPSNNYTFKDNILMKGETPIGGTTTGTNFLTGKSSVYISPGVKGLTSNGISATKMIINHEFIHAYHFANLPNSTAYSNGKVSERVTSAYSYIYAREYGFSNIATKSFYNTVISNGGFKYTNEWSFKNLSKILNLGIKW